MVNKQPKLGERMFTSRRGKIEAVLVANVHNDQAIVYNASNLQAYKCKINQLFKSASDVVFE